LSVYVVPACNSRAEGDASVLNGRPLPAALWRRRLTALVVLLVVAAAAIAWLVLAPRSYTSTAEVVAVPRGASAAAGVSADAAALEATLAEVADSPAVLRDAAASAAPHRAAWTLRREVQAVRLDGSYVIRIYVTDRNPRLAARLANAISSVLPQHDPTGGRLTLSVLRPATVPSGPSSPDLATAVTVAALGAIVLAVGAAAWRERIAGTVDDPAQLAALTGAPVLASVSRPADPGEQPSDGPADSDFRALRVGLEFAAGDDPTSVVVVAPAVADPAAAWTTVQLAAALAQVEHRVLIIDADFGAAQRHPMFKGKGPGLVDVLRGSVELRDAVRAAPVSGISVLPAGNTAGMSPANLLELRFHRAISEIDKEVDVVLVHAAPLADSDDARVMAVGNALLVLVPGGRVRAGVVRTMADHWRRSRARVAGTVLLGRRSRSA
jgi:Mrp family chromosome partitioning ATPase